MKCKQHCSCYLDMLEKKRKAGKKGAEATNKKYTTEMRKVAGKKAWENRQRKEKFDDIMGNPMKKLDEMIDGLHV